ncbi:DivIVA domain-containing protein [Actinocorallia longicatena]|uniref:Cell wall synthesis protein Wag31 n=1 Tax=Actinocorallia longicatena TaxID=111803 RepID=A0ABP6QII6_9ACTN
MDSRERLTPERVRAKVFATVRLREGYDMAEVDAFLHEVEETIDGLLSDVARLARVEPPSPAGDAVQLMSLAQETADKLVERAERQAEQIVADARTRADQMDRELAGRAAALERAAQDQQRLERIHAFLRGTGGSASAGLHDQLAQLQSLLDELTPSRPLVPAPGSPLDTRGKAVWPPQS